MRLFMTWSYIHQRKIYIFIIGSARFKLFAQVHNGRPQRGCAKLSAAQRCICNVFNLPFLRFHFIFGYHCLFLNPLTTFSFIEHLPALPFPCDTLCLLVCCRACQ